MKEVSVNEQCLVHSPISMLELLSDVALDPLPKSGRPATLSKEEKDHLVATVKRDGKHAE